MKQQFSLEEANNALVFVRPIMEDLKRLWDEIVELNGKGTEPRDKAVLDRLQKMEYFLQELKQVGCECKDFNSGMVDFPTLSNGEEVYLCWHLGEECIDHWHNKEDGFKGRQEIDERFLSSLTADPAASLL